MDHFYRYMRYLAALSLLMVRLAPAWPQEYSYLHYDTKDGLPSPVVHGISQDKDGFIWFATSSGLSRFDGKRFVNFTTADGLPSNEVFGTFVDSKNRVWILCFKNTVCYYYKGRLHNLFNEPWLKHIQIQGSVESYLETEQGEIIVNSREESWVIFPEQDRPPRRYTWREQTDSRLPAALLTSHAVRQMKQAPPMVLPPEVRRKLDYDSRHFSVQHYHYSNTRHELLLAIADPMRIRITNGRQEPGIISFPAARVRTCRFLNDSLVLLTGQHSGMAVVNIYTADTIAVYLPRTHLHDYFRDREGCIWISTNGKGVFQLCNTAFISYPFEKNGGRASIFNLSKSGDTLFATGSYGAHWKMTVSRAATTPGPISAPQFFTPSIARLLQLSRTTLRYSDANLRDLLHPLLEPATVKSIQQLDAGRMLAATASGAYLLDTRHFRITDTLCPIRSTCACYHAATYFIGTTEGLRLYRDGRTYFPGTKFPVLQSRITALLPSPDGTIWIGTDRGVAAYRNGKVRWHLTRENCGLSSNTCLSLYLDGRYLWAGTTAGLSKIDLGSTEPRVVARYDVTDGLKSDIVHAVLAEGTMVYAGTQDGLTCFDESLVPQNTPCGLLLTGIKVAGKETADPGEALLVLPHDRHSIRFSYAGLSFRSAGKILYRYRLLGLDDRWDTTREMSLDYPALPSGSYTLELQAVNKSGTKSPVLRRRLEISKSFWEKTPVRVSGMLLLIATVVILTLARQKYRQRKQHQMQEIRQKMLELEQQAMRAQMNPHFIFNCLNSIQHFILEQDARGASFYLGRFAGMVRQTLQNVSRKNISLAEEIAYLSGYLDLEQLQMTDTFSYSITLEDTIVAEDIMLPPMLLQPFVENAVKHGVAHMGSKGIITLSFGVKSGMLECTITDNGPGITGGRQADRGRHRPMGMAITRERIDLLNRLSEKTGQISLVTDWACTGEDKRYGTRITLRFPL